MSDRPLGYWLMHIHTGLEANFAALLRDRGLVRRGWQVLNTLGRGPADLPALDRALAHFLDDSEPSVAPQLTPLLARGWLRTDTEGRYVLTETGRAEYHAVTELVEAERAALLEGIGPEGYRTLIRLLERVSGNVDALAAARR
ncbi:MarR family winged helix-turn-helix transcriptional regulator [Nocardia sp. NPDC048505]|uniref:MarR family winged helix-turn-helix transcriptional regulator n=1 Tax=unclassified Nocardia TaxID=2637762 RepID=UPI0033D2D630